MTAVPWRPAVLALGMVLNLAVAYLILYRFRERDRAPNDSVDPDPDGTVECPECGTENHAEYRFCRACIDELPGENRVGGSMPSAPNGLVR